MATRQGHERCWFCRDCGQPMCPDCDTEGRSCTCVNASLARRRRHCAAPFPTETDLGDMSARQSGAAVVEYALLSTVLLMALAAFILTVRSLAGDLVGPTTTDLIRTTQTGDSTGGIGRAGVLYPPAITPPPTLRARRP